MNSDIKKYKIKIPEDLKRKRQESERAEKARQLREQYNSSEWFRIDSVFGYDWAYWLILCGARERGKSYAIMDNFLHQFFKSNYVRIFYWVRLTEVEAESLLKNKAQNLIDPDLRRKYITSKGYDLETNGTRVYIIKKNNKNKVIERHFMCFVLALSQAGNTKGNGIFDNEYIKKPRAMYNMCLDEFNRTVGQKNTFDIVAGLYTMVENLFRSVKTKIRVFCVANTTTDASCLLAQFNFIPRKFGIFKLKKRRCVIFNIPNNEAYNKRREGTITDTLISNEESSDISNAVEVDTRLVLPRKTKLTKVEAIIKFRKNKSEWFTLWKDNVITQYKGQTSSRIIAMRRGLDEIYLQEVVDSIIKLNDLRNYHFDNVTTYIKFKNYMLQIKPQTK